MGLFDSDFKIDDYVRERMPQLDNLDNRELFKRIVGNLTLDMYKHIKDEYDALEKRVFDEAPKATRMPNLITCVVERDRYDLTDENLFPMFTEDLDDVKVNAAEMIAAVKAGKEFRLYTCLIKADYLTLKDLTTERRFTGTIEHEYGTTAAQFIFRPNDRYRKKAEELYEVAALNYLPWRSLNTAYLFKLFDVCVVAIDEWDDETEVVKVTADFEELAEKILYKPLPIWNAKPVVIKGNSYPQPAIDRKYFEHYLYAKQFRPGREYLLHHSDAVIRNIRRQGGDMFIICDSDTPSDWHFYEFATAPDPANYDEPLISNEQDETFSRNLIEYFGQRIKTRTEMTRFFKSFKVSEHLSFVDAKIVDRPTRRQTYSTEEFIDYEFRTGERLNALEFSFRAADENFYLNRDIMSFLVTEIQHIFPEYLCVGKLVTA